MVRCRNTNGMVVLLLFLTAILIDAMPETWNCSNVFTLHHLSSKPGLYIKSSFERGCLCELRNPPIITINRKFHRQYVNLASLAILSLFIQCPINLPVSHFPPGFTRRNRRTPTEKFSKIKSRTISLRFTFQKLLSPSIHHYNDYSNKTNLIITFVPNNISAQFARGPPKIADYSP